MNSRAARGAVLCYVHEPWSRNDTDRTAYFTTQPLSEQWGDDWNDAPYDCNAGRPYTWRRERYASQPDGTHRFEPNPQPPWQIFEVEFTGPFDTPAGVAFNTPYSVEDVNAGKIPWLWADVPREGAPVVVAAGITYARFRKLVRRAGGTVGDLAELAHG